MRAELRITVLIICLAIVCQLIWGCRAVEPVREHPGFEWHPGKEEYVRLPPETPWQDRIKGVQARAAGVLSVGGAVGVAVAFGIGRFKGVALAALAAGVGLSVLTTVMEHWLWPWFALGSFVVLGAWKVAMLKR
jgi:hypothetical protein